MAPEDVSRIRIGTRLRTAREGARMTQAEAAARVGIARTTLVALEGDQRRIRLREVRQLAALYGTSANALMRRESVHVDIEPRFRKLMATDSQPARDASRVLTTLVSADIELERILGIDHTRSYPPERPLLPGDVRTQAERDAAEVRQWLGIGLSPIHDLVSLMELHFGIRIYFRPLDSKISGLFAYDEGIGAAVLLNAHHPRHRQTQTAAHEMGHFVCNRRKPAVVRVERIGATREERYADLFARAFLTPAHTVAHRFRDVTAGAPTFSRRHVIVLSRAFGVSREAMVRRLEELGLIRSGAWDWFQDNGGITADQVREVLGESADDAVAPVVANGATDVRLSLLAEAALRQQLVSEGQLSRLLDVSRVDLRRMLGDGDPDRSELSGAVKCRTLSRHLRTLGIPGGE